MVELCGQADTLDAVREAKEVTNRAVREANEMTVKSAVASSRVGPHQTRSGLQSREAEVWALAELSRALDKKVGIAVSYVFHLMIAFAHCEFHRTTNRLICWSP